MLGQDSKELPTITGHYAEEMRDALRRVRTNQLNDSDRHTMIRAEEITRQYHAVWK